MKKMLLALVILTAGVLFSCKSGGGDPKTVLINFIDAMAKKDMATARKLATTDSKQLFDMMESAMKMGGDNVKVDSDYDKANMEFGEPKIEGDKATIPVKDKKSGSITNFTLKKEDGNWKVAFNKASLLEMGMDKMKESGNEISDSISSGIEKLKDINIDSLGNEMKEGLEKLEENKEKLEEAGKELQKEAEKLNN